jgi:hypothetical protein
LWRLYDAAPTLEQLKAWRERLDERVQHIENFRRDGLRWHEEVTAKIGQVGGLDQRVRDLERWQQDRNANVGNWQRLKWGLVAAILLSLATGLGTSLWTYLRSTHVVTEQDLGNIRWRVETQIEQQKQALEQELERHRQQGRRLEEQIKRVEDENRRLREQVRPKPSAHEPPGDYPEPYSWTK